MLDEELITWIKDVSTTELPLIADEILTWGLISEIICLVVWSIVGMIIFFSGRLMLKFIDKDTEKITKELQTAAKNDKLDLEQVTRCDEIRTEQEFNSNCSIIVWIITILGLPTSLICIIKGIIYINVAPRLYIIDYIRDML